MHTGDITPQKEREKERNRMLEILDRTSDVARLGMWEVDLKTNEIYWSPVVCEIHGVAEDYRPNLATALNFYKEGESRDIIQKSVEKVIAHGLPYDVEVELVTAKGNSIWVRTVGNGEFEDGECVRLYGIFQDINHRKLSEMALNKANAEIKAIFNSKTVAIITTNDKGIIKWKERKL